MRLCQKRIAGETRPGVRDGPEVDSQDPRERRAESARDHAEPTSRHKMSKHSRCACAPRGQKVLKILTGGIRMHRRNSKGFTLVEILIVVIILGILAIIGIGAVALAVWIEILRRLP